MTTQHDKPKCWRPRFSVRSLVVVVTLVCCYAACWGPTKRQGVGDVLSVLTAPNVYQSHGTRIVSILVLGEEIRDVSARLPLLIRVTHDDLTSGIEHYYFWFFGYVAKLPYERELPIHNPPQLDDFIRKPPTIYDADVRIRATQL